MCNPDGRIREYGIQRFEFLHGPATRNQLHLGRSATESRKPLSRLNADEHLHRFAKQVSIVHSGVRDLERSLIEFIINGDGGSQEQFLSRINNDVL
jgi:hypothetical protein